MAKQAGDFFVEGTIDDLTFYKMCGEYYVRMKSNLTGKRFWKDKAFAGSRRSCERFASGNKIASKVYALIAEESRAKGLFSFLKKKAILLLKEGVPDIMAEEILFDYLIDFGFIETGEIEQPVKDASEKGIFLVYPELQTKMQAANYLSFGKTIQNLELGTRRKRTLNQNYLSEYG